jgi:hypothetical protein
MRHQHAAESESLGGGTAQPLLTKLLTKGIRAVPCRRTVGEGITENGGYIENCDFARLRGSNAVREHTEFQYCIGIFCMATRGRG